MKIRFVQRAAAAVACVGMLMPQSVLAAPAVPAASQQDIALRDGGLLVGQIVDAQGKAVAGSDVAVLLGKNEVVRTKTDKNGVFAAKGLRGGEYRVQAAGVQVAYRMWAPQTAPPAASNGALIVAGGEVISGQCNSCPPGYGCPPSGGGGIVGWIKDHPLLVATGVAAAIAIPLAVADDDDAS
ncbi:MAG: carboxypeptidase-like regulatory domain-containing protein [Planctomycetota bacterium]